MELKKSCTVCVENVRVVWSGLLHFKKRVGDTSSRNSMYTFFFLLFLVYSTEPFLGPFSVDSPRAIDLKKSEGLFLIHIFSLRGKFGSGGEGDSLGEDGIPQLAAVPISGKMLNSCLECVMRLG